MEALFLLRQVRGRRMALGAWTRWARYISACVGVLATVGALAVDGGSERELTVVADDNYPPYLFRDEQGNLRGYVADLWQRWSLRTGVRVNLTGSDWATAQAEFLAGKGQVIDTIFRSPERGEQYDFSPPYASIPVNIYVHRSIGGIVDAKSLRGFAVGVKAGDACSDRLTAQDVTGQVSFPSYGRLVEAAASGEIKVFCMDGPPADYLLYRADAHRQFRAAFSLFTGQLHRAVRTGDQPTLALVESGFSRLAPDEVRVLEEKWLETPINLEPLERNLIWGLLAAGLVGALMLIWVGLSRREVRRRTAELERERGFLRTLVNTLPDLIWLKDPQGVYLACNREFELFFGAAETDIVGRTDYDFVPKELADFFRAKDLEAAAHGRPKANEEQVTYASNGRRVLLETVKTPMFDSVGNLIGVLGIGRDITARKAGEESLRRSEERYRSLYDSMLDGYVRMDVDGRIVESNAAFRGMLDYAEDELTRLNYHDITPSGWTEAEAEIIDEEVLTLGHSGIYEKAFRRRDGIEFPVELQTYRLNDEDGNLLGTAAIVRDISERRENEETLRLWASVFASAGEGIVITNPAGEIVAVNRAFTVITGYPELEVIGLNPRFLRSGRHDAEFYAALWSALELTGQWQGELWNKRKNGEIYPEWLTISSVRDRQGRPTHYVAVFSDITAVKESQDALYHLAHHDPLTGLPNRTLLRDRLEHALERGRRDRQGVAVIFVDLDRFKQINDTLGHPVGDEILKLAARAMAAQLRASDTIARVGGDEFIIVLEKDVSSYSVSTVARKLVEIFGHPFPVAGRDLYLTASLGIGLFPKDGEDPDTLLRHADLALYKAKELGRNNYQYYEPSLGAGALERMTLENALRTALERRELYLVYQPMYRLSDRRFVGVEALLRWTNPELGDVPPAQFIPVAEEMGFIVELGAWVLREACRQLGAWRLAGCEVPRMAVNLSVHQLEREELVTDVADLLTEWGLHPGELEIEVTESTLLRQSGPAPEVLEGLRQLGVFLAVDDFGTGYSSLSALRQMPVNRLKIDASFVRDIGRDPNDEAIARAIIALAHSLGLETVAEGVERREQAVFLTDAGCDIVQGYFYGRPMRPEEVVGKIVEAN